MRRTRIRIANLRRGGLSRDERAKLKRLHRWVVMVRAGAAMFAEGKAERWLGKCQWCRREKWLSCCHIEPVGEYPSLAFDAENAFAGCTKCHLYRWHRDIEAARDFRIRLLGQARSDLLAIRARARGSRPDWEAVKLHLELQITNLIGYVP